MMPARDRGAPPPDSRPTLLLRREGDRVRIREPGTGAWLSIDAENVFDAEAINDLG